MLITSADIYPLAQRLHALIPEPLRRWSGFPTDTEVRDQLADAFLDACEEAIQPEDEESTHVVILTEALAGFLTMWGCRYGNLDDEVDRAQAILVIALGGTVREPGVYALREGTPITVAAIAHLLGWVFILDVPPEE